MNKALRARLVASRLAAVLLVMALVVGQVLVYPVHSANRIVNTLVDEADGSCSDGDCSLRDAIALSAAGDTIQFSVAGTITLNSALTIGKSLTILGPGASRLVLDGHNAVQVIYISAASTDVVNLSGMTIANGNSGGWFGGGIRNDNILNGGSHLSLDQVSISNNHSNGQGGGLFSNGPLLVTNSRFVSNSAGNGGGAAVSFKTATFTNTTFTGNQALTNDGGALYATNGTQEMLTISGCNFVANSAVRDGGAILVANDFPGNISGSMFSGNTADNGVGTQGVGGAISSNSAMTIDRSVFFGNSAGSATTSNNQGGAIYTSGPLNITNTTFNANKVRGAGGALYYYGTSATGLLTNVTIFGNTLIGPGAAGGIYTSMITVTMKNSIVGGASGGTCGGSGFTASSGSNLSTGSDCSPGFATTTPAALALTWKGWFFLPAHGSTAIDSGTNTGCPAVDQRGWPRPVDEHGGGSAICDVGAIEATPHYYEVLIPAVLR